MRTQVARAWQGPERRYRSRHMKSTHGGGVHLGPVCYIWGAMLHIWVRRCGGKMDSNFELPWPRYVLLCILRTGRAFSAKIQHSQNAGKVSVHAVRTIQHCGTCLVCWTLSRSP